MPQDLYWLYNLIIYAVISGQYFKVLGKSDDRNEKEEERCYIFRNRHRVAKETMYDSSSTQHLNFKYKTYWVCSTVFI